MGDSDDLVAKQKEFLDAFFKKGAEFAEELLRENEKLRFRVVKLEEQVAEQARAIPSAATLKELVEKIHSLEKERDTLLGRFSEVETEGREYAERYSEIERENASLASLYVATYQIHSAHDPRQVLRTLHEILLNFVGAKTSAFYAPAEGPPSLPPLTAEGMDGAGAVPLGEGIIGRVGETGRGYYSEVGPAGPEPRVCIPLQLKERIVGVVAIWDFLIQKTELLEGDFELFDLLVAQAASALEAACLAAGAGGASPLRYDALAGLLEPRE